MRGGTVCADMEDVGFAAGAVSVVEEGASRGADSFTDVLRIERGRAGISPVFMFVGSVNDVALDTTEDVEEDVAVGAAMSARAPAVWSVVALERNAEEDVWGGERVQGLSLALERLLFTNNVSRDSTLYEIWVRERERNIARAQT